MAQDPVSRMEQGIKLTTWLWVAGVLVSAAGVAMLESGSVVGRDRVRLEQFLFTAWTLGPPAWFVLQHYLWPPAPAAYDRFRAHQVLVRSVWAGAVAFLAAIVFGRWG